MLPCTLRIEPGRHTSSCTSDGVEGSRCCHGRARARRICAQQHLHRLRVGVERRLVQRHAAIACLFALTRRRPRGCQRAHGDAARTVLDCVMERQVRCTKRGGMGGPLKSTPGRRGRWAATLGSSRGKRTALICALCRLRPRCEKCLHHMG
eukprot:1885869-Prymnesium_polylepis.2